MSKQLLIEISAGELIDKLTILEIKMSRIAEQEKIINVQTEYESLKSIWSTQIQSSDQIEFLTSKLKLINEKLWQIEDDIRQCERESNFGQKFIKLARNVYKCNDQRASLKKQINKSLGSRLVEEKSYSLY